MQETKCYGSLEVLKATLASGIFVEQEETTHKWTLFDLEMNGRKLRGQSLIFYVGLLSI